MTSAHGGAAPLSLGVTEQEEAQEVEAAPPGSIPAGEMLEEILRDSPPIGAASSAGEGSAVERRQERAEARAPDPTAAAPAAFGVRTARVLGVSGRKATLALRGAADPVEAVIAPEVNPEVIKDALLNGDSVLVEVGVGQAPLVVAALQTQRPRELRLRAAVVHIEGDEEVLLRSGRGAVRVRADGDIEIVGSRISAVSRGLFRLVGRILRLN